MMPENFHTVVVSKKKLVKAFLNFPSVLYGSDKNKKPVGAIMERANWLQRNPGYHFETFNLKKAYKYAGDIMHIFNLGWSVAFRSVKRV